MNARLFHKAREIYERTFARGARVIGVTGPQAASGVTALAATLAAHCAISGGKSLLLDLSRAASSRSVQKTHLSAGKAAGGDRSKRAEEGYDFLSLAPCEVRRDPSSNAPALQTLLKDELATYEQIVVDLPHMSASGRIAAHGDHEAIACDAVVMVCRTSALDRATIESALETLTRRDTKVAGFIMDNDGATTIKQEILREIRYMKWLFPRALSDRFSANLKPGGYLRESS